MARDCATKPRPREQMAPAKGDRRHSGERHPIVTNLKVVDPDERDLNYCGHASNTPRPMKKLPSYHGRVEGKTTHILVDSGATENFIARGFLGNNTTKDAAEQATKIGMADGTVRDAGPVHTKLKVELGPYVTTVKVTELELFHFDAILGIPWLMEA